MKIAIDLSPIEDSPAGIGQYTSNLFSKLVEIAPSNEYYSYSSKSLRFKDTENIIINKKSLPFKGIFWMREAAKDMKKKNIDVLISPSNQLFSMLFPKTVQIIHDLAPVIYPEFFPRFAGTKYKRTTLIALKHAWRIAVPSYQIKKELMKFSKRDLSSVTTVVSPALNKWITTTPTNVEEVEKKFDLPMNYILSVSTLEPRKNIINLINGFAKLHKKNKLDHNLVIVGKKGWFYEEIFKVASNSGVSEKIKFLGYIPDEELSAIYKKAKAFVYLSNYEGFGMPPLEALSFNLPTLLSSIDVFKEIYSKYALFCDHTSTEDIADKLELLLKSTPTSSEELLKKYSWKNSAETLLNMINHE